MEETFGSELDRMAVPVTRNLSMTLQLLQPMEVLGTWGYANRVAGRVIHYSQETLHHRDYETILAQIRILSGVSPRTRELALSDLMDTENAVTPRIFLDSPSQSAAARRRLVQRRVRRN